MPLSRRDVVLGSGSVLILAACAAGAPQPRFEPISFDQQNTLSFDVGEIELENAFFTTQGPPHVAHLFPTSPGEAAEIWVRERIVAVGAGGKLRFTILEASAIEVPLDTKGGIKGYFTNEPDRRYDLKIAMRAEMFERDGRRFGQVEAEANRSTSVNEKATLGEKERAWDQATRALMADFDAEMSARVKEVFFSFYRI